MEFENNFKPSVTVAAVGDIHVGRRSEGKFRDLFEQMSSAADIILLCGDLTDAGLLEEAHVLANEASAATKPIVAVLGNHDFEAGKQVELSAILETAGITVLDGSACEFYGFGFAGVKGFGGGFEGKLLEPWGESPLKAFVQEAANECLKLEAALARIPTPDRIVVMHYSPVRDTVVGESPEIYPFLGSSRLQEPLLKFPARAVFHGHAHIGSLEGLTRNGIPVYNVAMPLLRARMPEQLPFRMLTFERTALTDYTAEDSAYAEARGSL